MGVSKNNVYVKDVCIWCKHNKECTHDKYIVTKILDRTTMRCAGYEYNRPPEQYVFNNTVFEI